MQFIDPIQPVFRNIGIHLFEEDTAYEVKQKNYIKDC